MQFKLFNTFDQHVTIDDLNGINQAKVLEMNDMRKNAMVVSY